MVFEFDHLFICTDIGACDADRLVSFGLVEGASNTYPGQGTANRRFFFHNAMLELLWVHDEAEATSEPIRLTRLWERWTNRKNGACPFGVCLRPATDGSDTVVFSSWAYRPPYLPKTMSIAVDTNSEVLTEPMLFQTPFGKRPDQGSPKQVRMSCSGEQSTRSHRCDFPVFLRMIGFCELVLKPVVVTCN